MDSLYRDFFMSLSVCLIVGRRTLITHAPILGDGYKFGYPSDKAASIFVYVTMELFGIGKRPSHSFLSSFEERFAHSVSQ